ncbi:MAG TPA: GNAT family N-acetyltransferase [Gemmatimonadales bacterium]|nr:GNAT family N-acetyltransferase [Gemmatimonadales bacterium]
MVRADRGETTHTYIVPLAVTIRRCTEQDLPDLEWYGLFTPHREIIRAAYDAQCRGDGLMLVAEVNGFPAGQVWIDLARYRAQRIGVLWAVRVYPFLCSLGIGRELVVAAEQWLHAHGYVGAELGVEPDNPDARRLYERLGYVVCRRARAAFSYTPPRGDAPITVEFDELIMRKRLRRYRQPPAQRPQARRAAS